ncbi:hypothetical protein WSK_1918 [Novosphingobium sp. Rr 2-17]|nr:hypothetical protein WSK_1918 [Novosphingobium sp. Rr 2-17]
MADLSNITEHLEIIGADGVHIGTVDKVEGDRIKMTKADSGSHSDHRHYLSGGLIAEAEGNQVRLSANGDAAVLLEEEGGATAFRQAGLGFAGTGANEARWRLSDTGQSAPVSSHDQEFCLRRVSQPFLAAADRSSALRLGDALPPLRSPFPEGSWFWPFHVGT